MASNDRQYECVVLGATGYTGRYTAEHITKHLPTDFKWAVAGRSESKLKSIVNDLRSLDSDRLQPGIEVVQLEKSELLNLAIKTKVLITTTGPYHKYGTPVFEACAETGTHYLDVTAETPWVHSMIDKHHDSARQKGAIMISQMGVESVPVDMVTWMLVSHIRHALGVGTTEVINTLYDLKSSASGGTLSTILTIFDTYSLSDLAKSGAPWALCPIPPPKKKTSRPLTEQLTGLRTVSDLGLLTDNPQAPADIPIIQRSYGLHDGGKLYGPNFWTTGYMKTRNALTGFGFHCAFVGGLIALLLPPFRWILKRLVYQPGNGPTKDEVANDFIEWRSIAYADTIDPSDPKRAYARMRWNGSLYHLTGVCVAEGALTIARQKTPAHQMGGGVLTPSTLGEPYLERLQKAGLKVEIKILP